MVIYTYVKKYKSIGVCYGLNYALRLNSYVGSPNPSTSEYDLTENKITADMIT